MKLRIVNKQFIGFKKYSFWNKLNVQFYLYVYTFDACQKYVHIKVHILQSFL